MHEHWSNIRPFISISAIGLSWEHSHLIRIWDNGTIDMIISGINGNAKQYIFCTVMTITPQPMHLLSLGVHAYRDNILNRIFTGSHSSININTDELIPVKNRDNQILMGWAYIERCDTQMRFFLRLQCCSTKLALKELLVGSNVRNSSFNGTSYFHRDQKMNMNVPKRMLKHSMACSRYFVLVDWCRELMMSSLSLLLSSSSSVWSVMPQNHFNNMALVRLSLESEMM